MPDLKAYNILTDFVNAKADAGRLMREVLDSAISVGLDTVLINAITCTFYFKADLSTEDITLLDALVAVHTGEVLERVIPPRTADNKEIVRADSRPSGTNTYFTCSGDNATIGGGKKLFWDFSNSDDDVSVGVPIGFKRKAIDISFSENVYMKEGSFYFFDALKGSYGSMLVICPVGNYYYDHNGIPQLAAEDVPLVRFVNEHFFTGSCPMGDELNTEGAQENPIPPNYKLRIEITVSDTDNLSYGWVSLELYRARTILLPGESV